jgi:hypothetical protein
MFRKQIILSIIHHRQNPFNYPSTRLFVMLSIKIFKNKQSEHTLHDHLHTSPHEKQYLGVTTETVVATVIYYSHYSVNEITISYPAYSRKINTANFCKIKEVANLALCKKTYYW